MEYLSRQWVFPQIKCSSSASCGIWRQAHAGTGPDQNLSGPHRGHSRSRDQPRGRGQPLGEVEVGSGSWRVQGHLQLRPQGNIIITINFIMFWFFLLLVLAFFCFFFPWVTRLRISLALPSLNPCCTFSVSCFRRGDSTHPSFPVLVWQVLSSYWASKAWPPFSIGFLTLVKLK